MEPLALLLESAMELMREGETCQLCPVPLEVAGHVSAVPPGATVSYTVTLQSFQRGKAVWEMGAGELLTLARRHKDRGTQLFREGDARAAAVCYSRAVMLALALTPAPTAGGTATAGGTGERGVGSEEKGAGSEVGAEEREELTVALFLNLAACQLKLRQNGHAFENCSRVLQLRPGCVKALYRRGMAAMHMGDLARAEGDLREAGRLEPGSRAVRKQQRELARRRQLQDARLSDALKSMFTSA